MLPILCVLSAQAGMIDVTSAIGLGPDVVPETVARVLFADLNKDGWPDAVINRHRIFLNEPSEVSPIGRTFKEVPANRTGLEMPEAGTTTNFADLDNDGNLDAIVAENVQPDNPQWKDHGRRTRWQKGSGTGHFAKPQPLPTPPRPTIAVAVADLNFDGRLDIFFGNSYQTGSYAGFPGDLLLSDGKGSWKHSALPEETVPFDDEQDAGARPTYGAMIASLDGKQPGILSLSYGRRWNRYWIRQDDGWADVAPRLGIDGDQVRDGAYPDWLYERAKTDTRFPTKPEKPFRSNGNTFDSAVADVDNDGRFDLFLSEITHAWAGAASDRSRLLFQAADGTFAPRSRYGVDRIPSIHDQRWNQGDLCRTRRHELRRAPGFDPLRRRLP